MSILKTLVVYVIIGIGAMMQCQSPTQSVQKSGKNLFAPLKVGNHWVYFHDYVESDASSILHMHDSVSLLVVDSFIIDNHIAYGVVQDFHEMDTQSLMKYSFDTSAGNTSPIVQRTITSSTDSHSVFKDTFYIVSDTVNSFRQNTGINAPLGINRFFRLSNCPDSSLRNIFFNGDSLEATGGASELYIESYGLVYTYMFHQGPTTGRESRTILYEFNNQRLDTNDIKRLANQL